jgi:hypothetical protein
MAVSISGVYSVEWEDYSDWWTGENVEESGRVLMVMMSRHLPEDSKENHENPKSG